ncbi:PHD finger protein 7-like [Gallus gallus]|uniref:PHD finger protein 7-like n=1 Tax=Gallus gallus TaxID=9031 RepID=UPI001AE8AC6A|nr:PHD finger protein 7-like [Gallus gallus]
MVCPACAHCWFHRGCIQQQALNAGAWCFRCPSCQDILLFLAEMFLMGIHIPLRRPLWEESDAYESLLERHSRCNACECLYRGGREQAEREGPWQLILCSSCAAQGTHRRCSTFGRHRRQLGSVTAVLAWAPWVVRLQIPTAGPEETMRAGAVANTDDTPKSTFKMNITTASIKDLFQAGSDEVAEGSLSAINSMPGDWGT